MRLNPSASYATRHRHMRLVVPTSKIPQGESITPARSSHPPASTMLPSSSGLSTSHESATMALCWTLGNLFRASQTCTHASFACK
eukprot:49115-Eustigmatos_ZCMA.PRE.1